MKTSFNVISLMGLIPKPSKKFKGNNSTSLYQADLCVLIGANSEIRLFAVFHSLKHSLSVFWLLQLGQLPNKIKTNESLSQGCATGGL